MDAFEKYNLVNAVIRTEDVFDYIGAKVDKQDPHKMTFCCPYHTDDLPSLNVDLTSGRFNCFACDNKGGGSYAAAKYYLEHQSGGRVSSVTVINFLIEINPIVEMYKPMFTVRQQREYERGVNKRKAFKERAYSDNSAHILANSRTKLTAKEHATYIDAVMMGLSDQFIATNLIVKDRRTTGELPDELLKLIGDD